ncbi:hypothetical protein SAMN02744040_01930 [Tepidibacter thalassicus DSM 15285]|uniref:Uncharacterized protein n=1 Tax=Tepidibacter thalassicus DSM 15285 TaxID=1123350 RepID=A0A1M5SV68_9FIRM|nr:hypothetical protein SAMN02744040_01930 [Tepidibacter thalassicus DSM 15285]
MVFLKLCFSISSLVFLILTIMSMKLKRNHIVTIVPLILFIINFIVLLLVKYNIL